MVNNFNYKINKKSKDNFTKSQRQLRVGEELRHLISNVLFRETFYDQIIENNNITITEVNVSPDLKNAKVYIMPLGGENKFEVLDSLKKANGRIKKLISNNINLRQIPKLQFRIDETFEYAKNKFQVGAMNSFDFTQAKQRYELAQSELIRTKYDYIFKLKVLEFYFGVPITVN